MMQSNSWFVKFVIWFMIFLMSVGFAALVVTPFLGGTTLFGGGSGDSATQKQLDEARSDVRKHKCADAKQTVTTKQKDTCRDALITVAQAYRTLATPDADATDYPKGYKQNLSRAEDAYRDAYELDTTDADTAQDFAALLQELQGVGVDTDGTAQAVKILQPLVKGDPKNEDLLTSLAQAQSSASDYDGAIASYTSFLKLFPNSGQVDTIKTTITQLKDAKKQAAAQSSSSALSNLTTSTS
jgi:tetratricopeptide (TPR) repeat protein